MPRTGSPPAAFLQGGTGLIRHIHLPQGDLCYEWTRKRVKNWNLRIRPDGSAALSTPYGVSGAEADRYIAAKAAWIAAARQRLAGRNAARSFNDGATLSVAGHPVRLHIATGDPGPAAWESGLLILRIPDGLPPDGREKETRAALRRALLPRAARMLEEQLVLCLPLVEAETGRRADRPVLTMRWMRSRWGSCSPGRNRIALNAALILAPPECAAYVVIHELCHRIHPDHSPAFHQLVARVLRRAGLPEETTLRRRLRDSEAAGLMKGLMD